MKQQQGEFPQQTSSMRGAHLKLSQLKSKLGPQELREKNANRMKTMVYFYIHISICIYCYFFVKTCQISTWVLSQAVVNSLTRTWPVVLLSVLFTALLNAAPLQPNMLADLWLVKYLLNLACLAPVGSPVSPFPDRYHRAATSSKGLCQKRWVPWAKRVKCSLLRTWYWWLEFFPGPPVQFLNPPEQVEVRVGERAQLYCEFRSSSVPVACCWIYNRDKVKKSVFTLFSGPSNAFSILNIFSGGGNNPAGIRQEQWESKQCGDL